MADFVLRAIGAVIEALLNTLIAHTGKCALSFCKLKSNALVEYLIGFFIWAIVVIVLTVFIAALNAKL